MRSLHGARHFCWPSTARYRTSDACFSWKWRALANSEHSQHNVYDRASLCELTPSVHVLLRAMPHSSTILPTHRHLPKGVGMPRCIAEHPPTTVASRAYEPHGIAASLPLKPAISRATATCGLYEPVFQSAGTSSMTLSLWKPESTLVHLPTSWSEGCTSASGNLQPQGQQRLMPSTHGWYNR